MGNTITATIPCGEERHDIQMACNVTLTDTRMALLDTCPLLPVALDDMENKTEGRRSGGR